MHKKVLSLDFDFAGCGRDRGFFEWKGFPVDVTNNHLVELRLASCEVRQLDLLRKLSLMSIAILGEQTMPNIFSGCPNLEELSICGGTGLRYLKVPEQHPLKKQWLNHKCLLKLDLRCSNLKELILVASPGFEMLNCPKLTSLDFSGHMHSVFLKDAASVVEAAIHLHESWPCVHPFCLYNAGTDISCGNMVEGEFLGLILLLEKLRHCSLFKLCTWIFSVLTIWEIKGHPSLSYKWKHVMALLGLANWIIPGVSRLLRHCECLETLTVNFYPCRDDKLKFFGAEMQEAYGFDEGYCGSSFRGSNGCLQLHLKKVMVQRFVTDPLSIQFIVFLLSNASCLEELEISARKPPRYS